MVPQYLQKQQFLHNRDQRNKYFNNKKMKIDTLFKIISLNNQQDKNLFVFKIVIDYLDLSDAP